MSGILSALRSHPCLDVKPSTSTGVLRHENAPCSLLVRVLLICYCPPFQLKNVPYERATQRELDYMISAGVLLSGTRSATLVPYADALYFLADLKRPQMHHNKEQQAVDAPPPSWLVTRPRIHRRKPHPWELGRSLRMHGGTLVAGPALLDLNQFADYTIDTR